MALDAQVRDALRHFLKQRMTLVLIGEVIGLIGAFALTRVIRGLLFGVAPTDAMTFIAVAAVLTSVALLACYFPARRAAKVDPLVALRHQ
jgi:putative ABC transport system permease protein